MLARLPASEVAATFVVDTSGNDSEFVATYDGGDGFAFFSRLLRKLFPGKTAASVQFLIRISERSAYRLVAGTTQPTGDTIIRFLRSTEGGRVLDAIMAGCTAPWWAKHQLDREHAKAFRNSMRAVGVQLDLPFE